MASDTATALPESSPGRRSRASDGRSAFDHSGQRRHGRLRLLSPITLRILAVNVLALALLAGGILFLGQYERGLIESELGVLRAQSRLLGVALAEGALDSRSEADRELAAEPAQRLVRRLTEPDGARIRLFAPDGRLIADSRKLLGPGGVIEIEPLTDPGGRGVVERLVNAAYNAIVRLLPTPSRFPRYREAPVQHAEQYIEALRALGGDTSHAVRRLDNGTLVLSVATPVQDYKRVVGALMLTSRALHIHDAIRSVRLGIFAAFTVALAVTILLSIYLASTIARPVRLLASAAERVRHGRGRQEEIPDLSARHDEIGDLSAALREMTEALWQRMDAIERFAADVAHEIKNPLSSLRSAVETASRVRDPDQQQRLMSIILDDVQRLDRLISDISAASRLDAELSRANTGVVDIGRMLGALAEIHGMSDSPAESAKRARISVHLGGAGPLTVVGVEDRLVQVFRNLIANAVSFSPPGGEVVVNASRHGDRVIVRVEDSGPGIPPGKEESIFERFYSERPQGEKFGTHSGLGLSISRQIVAAHGGEVRAENRLGPENQVLGARFIVTLRAA